MSVSDDFLIYIRILPGNLDVSPLAQGCIPHLVRSRQGVDKFSGPFACDGLTALQHFTDARSDFSEAAVCGRNNRGAAHRRRNPEAARESKRPRPTTGP